MEEKNIKKSVDPSAMGLFGLALVTFVVSSSKLGWTSGTLGLIPWAIFLGAILQLIAAVYDYKQGNALGSLAFFAYGFFWLALGMIYAFNNGVIGNSTGAVMDPKILGFAYLAYLILSLFMTVGATTTSKLLFCIYVLIDLLFIGLVLSSFKIATEFGHNLAGISELGIAILSFYACGANILNQHFGYKLLPTGKPFNWLVKKPSPDSK